MISLQRLSKRFGNVHAVRGVTLEVPEGTCIAIHGPSGGGKTTLLRLIAGLDVPDSGEIQIEGALVSDPTFVLPPHRRRMGFVFQEPTLWPHLTVLSNVLFGLGGSPRREAREKAQHFLDSLEIGELSDRYPAELSGGQARRVAIARALAPGPRRLLLDEPTTHLEPGLKRSVLDVILGSVRESGASLIWVTHDPDEAASVAGEIKEMREGCLADL
jgi:iron(III) transport system ATP-binding protein